MSKEDEFRIFDYASSLFVKYKLPVKTYIISTVEDKSRKIEKWHHDDVFTIYVISLKDKDGLKSLNRIKSKIENNETLNGEDIVLFISIVFMESDLSESELLFKTANLTNKAIFKSEFIRNQLKAVQLILGDKFIRDKDEFKKFKRVVSMKSSYFTSVFERIGEDIREESKKEFLEEGIGKGRLIGLDEGKRIGKVEGERIGKVEGEEKRAISVARWMLNRDMSIEDISEATELPFDRIVSLKKDMGL